MVDDGAFDTVTEKEVGNHWMSSTVSGNRQKYSRKRLTRELEKHVRRMVLQAAEAQGPEGDINLAWIRRTSKRQAGLNAVYGSTTYFWATLLVTDGLISPERLPDGPETGTHLRKREWENAMQKWRRHLLLLVILTRWQAMVPFIHL